MSNSFNKMKFVYILMLPFIIMNNAIANDILPPHIRDSLYNFEARRDYEGLRFHDPDTLVAVENDRDSVYTGFVIPFLKKGFKVDKDADLRPGDRIRQIPYDVSIIRKVKTKEDSDTNFFKRIKKISTLNDFKGFVRIGSAFEALEYLRFASSPITEIHFGWAREVYCLSNLVETSAEINNMAVASTDECRQMGFSPPEGPFDLVIADVKVKVKGTLSFPAQTTLSQLTESLKRTTTEEKEIEIEAEEIGKPVKVKTKGNLTQEEQSLVSALAEQVRAGLMKVEIEIEAELDEKKIPQFFVISRTVYSKADRAFVKVTEEVGQDGSWRILGKKVIAPLTKETFKFYSR